MPALFTNNASATLLNELAADGTSLAVVSGQGARFPSLSGGNYFMLTLVGLDGNGNETAWEIVQCTARSNDLFTIVRAQEGTTARVWPAATRVELRVTAGTLDAFLVAVDGGLY